MHYAAGEDYMEIVELLIANGADVNVKGENGWTPLHEAVREDQKEVVKLLITKGAGVNPKTNSGETPLDVAEDEIADMLRKHGGKKGEELKAEGK
jgi:ankyrin repeat protein